MTEKHKFNVGKFDISTRKRAISRADIRKIEAYQPAHRHTGKFAQLRNQLQVERMQRANDVFLFSFFAAGINFVDLCQIRWENITTDEKGIAWLRYTRQKTGGKFLIKHADPTLVMIKRYRPITYNGPSSYVFPILDGNTYKTPTQIDNRLNKVLGQVNADDNFATTRKLALQVLSRVDDRESIKNRRKRAGWDDSYLRQIIDLFKCV